MKYITSKELQDSTVPGPDMVLMEKDVLDKYSAGGIAFTGKYVANATRNAGTGVILKLSPFRSEDEYCNYLLSVLKPGDRIGVNPATPLIAPTKPNQPIQNDDGTEDRTFLIHVKDIFCFITENEDQSKSLTDRISTWK